LLNCLDPLKGLSAKLQKRDSDVIAAYQLIDMAIGEVSDVRANIDLIWNKWFQEAETIANSIGSEIKLQRMTKHQKHRSNTLFDTAR